MALIVALFGAAGSAPADAAPLGAGAGTTGAQARIVIGSTAVPPGGQGTIDATLFSSTGGVVATLNDIALAPPLSIPELMNVATTLVEAIDAADDMIAVADASDLPDLGSVRIAGEIVLYGAKLGNVLVVAARGADGTTAAAHAAGTAVEVPTRLPECEMSATVAQLGKSAVFSYLPDGCAPGGSGEPCVGVRAIVIGVSNFTEIPDDTLLYRCTIEAGSQSEPGSFPVGCPEGEDVGDPFQPAQASGDPDVDPVPFVTDCPDGTVQVTAANPVRIEIGSAVVEPGGIGVIDATLRTGGNEVAGTLNDIRFESQARIGSVSTGSTLAAAIDADDVAIELADSSTFPDFGVVSIGDELIAYGSKNGNTLQMAERGFQGTDAASHAEGAAVVATSEQRPDCRASDEIVGLGKSAVFSFVPDGCSAGVDCLAVRAIVVDIDGFDPIPDNTRLYECGVEAGDVEDVFPLVCPEGGGVAPPFEPAQASGVPPSGSGSGLPADFDTLCPDGEVIVQFLGTPPSATPTTTGEATPTPTVTPTTTGSVLPTSTRTPTPTVSPTASVIGGACAGDCNRNDVVSVDELIRGVNIGLEREPLASCEPLDANDDDEITVDELVGAVSNAIEGCP